MRSNVCWSMIPSLLQDIANLQDIFNSYITPPVVDVGSWQGRLQEARQKVHAQLNEIEEEARETLERNSSSQAENALIIVPLIRDGRLQEAERRINEFAAVTEGSDSFVTIVLSAIAKVQAIGQRWHEMDLVLSGSFVDYDLFVQIGSDAPAKAQKFFNAKTFLKVCASCVKIVVFVLLKFVFVCVFCFHGSENMNVNVNGNGNGNGNGNWNAI